MNEKNANKVSDPRDRLKVRAAQAICKYCHCEHGPTMDWLTELETKLDSSDIDQMRFILADIDNPQEWAVVKAYFDYVSARSLGRWIQRN